MNGRARKIAVAAMALALGTAAADSAYAAHAHVDTDRLVFSAGPGETNVVTVRPVSRGRILIADAGATITAGAGCTGAPLEHAVICTLNSVDPVAALWLSLGNGSDVATVAGDYFLIEVDAGHGHDRVDLTDAMATGPFISSPFTYVQLGGGDDTLELGSSVDAAVEVFSGDGDDVVNATAVLGGQFHGDRGNDRITAGGWVSGGEGADVLDSSTTADVGELDGGPGDDSIDTDDSFWDVVRCGTGIDAVDADVEDEHYDCETVS